MDNGNKPVDGGHLLLEPDEVLELGLSKQQSEVVLRPFVGSSEVINGKLRYCLWIDDANHQ